MNTWVEDEFGDVDFGDDRLNQRFSFLVAQLSQNAGDSIQLACEDWASLKAAYRFFDNPKVSQNEINRAHVESTKFLNLAAKSWKAG